MWNYFKEIWPGINGGMIILLLFMIAVFYYDGYNYNIKILSPKNIKTINNFEEKRKLLEELNRDGIILTPAEYTNNIVSYYNTSLFILATLLVGFSFISYIHFRNLTDRQINVTLRELIRNDKQVRDVIRDEILGEADDLFASADVVDNLRHKVEILETNEEVIKEILESVNHVEINEVEV